MFYLKTSFAGIVPGGASQNKVATLQNVQDSNRAPPNKIEKKSNDHKDEPPALAAFGSHV